MFLVVNSVLVGKLPWKPPMIEGRSLSYRGEHKVLFAFLLPVFVPFCEHLGGEVVGKAGCLQGGSLVPGGGEGSLRMAHAYLLNIECIRAPVIPANKQIKRKRLQNATLKITPVTGGCEDEAR